MLATGFQSTVTSFSFAVAPPAIVGIVTSKMLAAKSPNAPVPLRTLYLISGSVDVVSYVAPVMAAIVRYATAPFTVRPDATEST